MSTPPPIPSDAKKQRRRQKKQAHQIAYNQSVSAKKTKKSHFSLIPLIIIVLLSTAFTFYMDSRTSNAAHGLTPVELNQRIESVALQYDIRDHLDELHAIVEVESNGQSEDVFQSSESAGLPPNSLGVDDSIEQGVSYYKSLLERAAELGVDQDAVYQAYNYGIGYLDFVAENGGVHTQELAEEFARIHSNGRIVTYPNPIAVEANGGWRYDYGNMFYVKLIHQALQN
ncbi:MAG: lysozyme family protein [Allobaculum sp.]